MAIYQDGVEYPDEAAHEAAMNPVIPESLKRVYIFTDKGEIPPHDTEDNNEIAPPTGTQDQNIITPKSLQHNQEFMNNPGNVYNDQGDVIDFDFSQGRDLLNRMPLESPEKPADAFKFDPGTQVAPQNLASPEPSNGLSMVGAVTDWWNRQKKTAETLGSSAGAMLKGPNLEEDKAILGGLWESIKDFATHPGNVYQGKADPMDVSKALNMATTMVFGPMPVAGKMADGTLGSFAGVKSKTINKEKLYKAQNMELEGYHPDEIWKETGTFRGADKRWRQEIPDKDAVLHDRAFEKTITQPSVTSQIEALKDKKMGKPGEGTPKGWGSVEPAGEETWTLKAKGWLEPPKDGNLEDTLRYLFRMNDPKYQEFEKLQNVLNHPALFEAYPELKNIKVAELPADVAAKGIKGQVSGDTIFLAPNLNPDYIRSVLLHEAQHVIQRVENFARGGNQWEFKPPKLKAAEEQFDKVSKKTFDEMAANRDIGLKRSTLEYVADLKKNSILFPEEPAFANKLSQAEKEWHSLGWDEEFKRLTTIGEGKAVLTKEADRHLELYKRLQGEVEARNVQTRADMGEMERLLKSPRSTEDRPRFVQQEVGHSESVIRQNMVDDNLSNMRNAANDNVLSTPQSRKADRMERSAKAFKELQDLQKELDAKIASREAKKVQDAIDERRVYTPRWPSNQNFRTLNEHEQFLKDYDALKQFGDKLSEKGNWTELNVHKYNKMGREMSKKQGFDWTDVEYTR